MKQLRNIVNKLYKKDNNNYGQYRIASNKDIYYIYHNHCKQKPSLFGLIKLDPIIEYRYIPVFGEHMVKLKTRTGNSIIYRFYFSKDNNIIPHMFEFRYIENLTYTRHIVELDGSHTYRINGFTTPEYDDAMMKFNDLMVYYAKLSYYAFHGGLITV